MSGTKKGTKKVATKATRSERIRAALAKTVAKIGVANLAAETNPAAVVRRETFRVSGKALGISSANALLAFDAVTFDALGRANPLPAAAKRGGKALDAAIAKRRDAGVRWEIVAASASETLGRPFSVSATKKAYERAKGEGATAESYVGRGTKAALSDEAYDALSESETGAA